MAHFSPKNSAVEYILGFQHCNEAFNLYDLVTQDFKTDQGTYLKTRLTGCKELYALVPGIGVALQGTMQGQVSIQRMELLNP